MACSVHVHLPVVCNLRAFLRRLIMRFRNLLLAAAITVTGLAAGVSGQTMIDGVKVDLPYAVRVSDDLVLEPGEYEIRRASQNQDQVLRIYSNDKMRYETHVITVPALERSEEHTSELQSP